MVCTVFLDAVKGVGVSLFPINDRIHCLLPCMRSPRSIPGVFLRCAFFCPDCGFVKYCYR